MTTALLPKTALATLAAVALFLPFGAPLPGSCLRTIGVAGAAPSPSPSCGGDLRECLRQSADMRQTTFGGRYVTADDVARCMEAFRSCTSGGASRGGNTGPPKSTAAGGDGTKSLPARFGITMDDSTGTESDCQVNGTDVTCTETWSKPPEWTDSYSGTFSGTHAGLEMTGTLTTEETGHDIYDPACRWRQEQTTSSVTYTFSPEGTVTAQYGPGQWSTTRSGSCSKPESGTTESGSERDGTWAGR